MLPKTARALNRPIDLEPVAQFAKEAREHECIVLWLAQLAVMGHKGKGVGHSEARQDSMIVPREDSMINPQGRVSVSVCVCV